ncbi:MULTISPECIES: hypothetical protein [unclassified Streptomyces]|uniref:hypothetical protein n=1 Tax=unclassified Streptomyces TaxID=2593676 RepID=UPI000879CB8D|nr:MULTISPECIES: hypothetical protein [unclassified Streptomyces]REH18393.1 hypothetical protein BX268_0081 [Streptomyces sp. 2221.1]SDS22529.1 hypothetical protein SAMN05428941_0086 [Streptomyces sp. 2114.2]
MDRRLIQTAVFGSPDSDEPALCPETVEELDDFRREHANDTIWCGTMFEGGCGRQLTTRRYLDKIPHFAHFGSGGTDQTCGRKNRGKDDANHLFTKAYLASWLRAQGITAEFSFPEPMGSAVVAHLEDGRTLLVHLDRGRPVAWSPEHWAVILGPGVRDPDALTQRGSIHRVRFDDRPGGGRTMQFGTEVYGQGTDRWDALSDIVLTSDGLTSKNKPTVTPQPNAAPAPVITPGKREIVTVTSRASYNPRRADPVLKVLRGVDLDNGSPQGIRDSISSIQRLLTTDLTKDETDRLRFALRRCDQRLEKHAQRRRKVVQQLKDDPTEDLYYLAVELVNGDSDASQEEKDVIAVLTPRIKQAQAARRAELERAREAKREADERARQARRAAMEEQRADWMAAIELQSSARLQQTRIENVRELAPAIRGALKKAAREGRTTNWPELRQKTGLRQLDRLDQADKLELLVLVDAATTAEEPLWSTLLVTPDDSVTLRLYRDVSRRLDRPTVPADDEDLAKQLATDRSKLHSSR